MSTEVVSLTNVERWRICIEHGRSLRVIPEERRTARDKALQREAESYGFTSDDRDAVRSVWPILGMSRCGAVATFGLPDATDYSVGTTQADQRWVYRKRKLYLYFRGDTLISYEAR